MHEKTLLQTLRERQGWTLREAGRQLGVRHTTVRSWEIPATPGAAVHRPKPATLRRILKHYPADKRERERLISESALGDEQARDAA